MTANIHIFLNTNSYLVFVLICTMNLVGNLKHTFQKLFGLNSLGYSQIIQLGTKGEVWINTSEPYKIYNEIPQARVVINKFSKLFSNADIYIERKAGDEWEADRNHKAMATIIQPNFKQGQNDFYKDMAEKFCTYGNNFEYVNKPSIVGDIEGRFNISPRYLKPELTGKYFDQLDMEGVVSRYWYDDGTGRKQYNTKDILWLTETDLDNPLMGVSKLVALKFPLSNAKGSYSYLNSIINNKGALGFVVGRSKEDGGSQPMLQEDKETLEKGYLNDYGHGSGQIPFKILRGDVGFVPTSYPVKEMMLFETLDHGLAITAQMYGLSTNIFDTKTTFENLKNGMVQSYQDAIIPFADTVQQAETNKLRELGVLKENERVRMSYDHIEILQESKLSGVQAIERGISAMINAVNNGLMTAAEAKPFLDRLRAVLT
jgi:phage portal protein BeeE